MPGQRLLEHVGVTADEEKVYVTLLEHPGATLTDLAGLAGVPRRQLQRVVAALERHGLVSRSAEPRERYLAAPPTEAVGALVAQREDALHETRAAAAELEERMRSVAPPRESGSMVQIVSGREAAARRYTQIERAAREQVLIFDRPPYYSTASTDEVNETEQESIARGVRWRAVYAQEALTIPGGYDHVRKSIRMGEEARVMAELPLKLTLADHRIGAVPLALENPDLGGGTLLVHPSSLLDALHVLFEFVWERATPLRLSPTGDLADVPDAGGPGSEELVSLLAAGLKDDTIARQLGVATRTVERRMQTLMADLDAGTRFQAGWLAAQRQLVGPDQSPER